MLKYGYLLLKLVIKPISDIWDKHKNFANHYDEIQERIKKINQQIKEIRELSKLQDLDEEYRDHEKLLDRIKKNKEKKSYRQVG